MLRLPLRHRDIHDSATLSRVYFENTLCLSPLITVPCGAGSMKRTEVGVRVALGDTGNHSHMIIIHSKGDIFIRFRWSGND